VNGLKGEGYYDMSERELTATKHNGDLGHNTMVSYDHCDYLSNDGEYFSFEEVLLSDKMRYFSLTAKEALSLLAWLQQEREKLKQLVKEQEGV